MKPRSIKIKTLELCLTIAISFDQWMLQRLISITIPINADKIIEIIIKLKINAICMIEKLKKIERIIPATRLGMMNNMNIAITLPKMIWEIVIGSIFKSQKYFPSRENVVEVVLASRFDIIMIMMEMENPSLIPNISNVPVKTETAKIINTNGPAQVFKRTIGEEKMRPYSLAKMENIGFLLLAW